MLDWYSPMQHVMEMSTAAAIPFFPYWICLQMVQTPSINIPS